MFRIRLVTAAAAATGVALAVAGSAGAAAPKLNGTVGPGFTISLKDASGKSVKKLKPGKYTITVKDLASIHNFHLTGPGVNKKTDVAGTGTTTWTVTLKKGSYKFMCDPHASSMNGSFKVG